MGRNPTNDPVDPERTEDSFPEHGAPHEAPPEKQEETPVERPAEGSPKGDLLADIRRQVDRLERENRDLRKKIEPREPEVRRGDEEEDIDWEKELFANPKAAMKRSIEIASKRAEDRIRAERQKDAGQREFWSEFYRRNNDLRDDHDLVEVVLQKNLPELSDLPIDDGYKRLAELTRERIMRYMGSGKGSSKKAVAEGASAIPGKSAPKGPQEPKISTLSDIIAERRRRRRGQAA